MSDDTAKFDSSPQRSSDIVMDFTNVDKTFVTERSRVHALTNVTFQVRRGMVTGLIGPDAAGKTTLMRLAVGLMTPDSGKITIVDKDVLAESLQVQAAVGYMPQRFGLYEDLTVQENLNLYADLQGVPAKDRPARYEELMRMTGLAPFTNRLAARLSGGMKQKLGLACTLVRSPQVLLLDEPTVGVDPLSRRELWNIVYRLVREQNMTVLLSTAYLEEAERCGEIIMLHGGQLLGRGPPEHFKKQVSGRTYLAAMPGLKKRRLQEELAHAPGVVDAVIQADSVRLVMENASPPPRQNLPEDVMGMSLTPADPRFEDTFVTLLHNRHTAGAKARPGMSLYGRPKDATHSDEPVIEVQDLQRRFGKFYAVKGISFDVHAGEIFGLLGANGAGKSTTFRMLCGLLPATAGELRVAGVDLRRAAAEARLRIGYMSQKFSLYANLTVRHNLNFFSSAYSLSGRHRAERIDWALKQFDLAPVADNTCTDLSLGYKQRLAMACALMHGPEILFLDEPTSGVDPLARREFWNIINHLAELGVTVMVTTHFMDEAEYCDRLAIMSLGKILALGTPAEIRADAASPQTPAPTMADAFIKLIEAAEPERAAS